MITRTRLSTIFHLIELSIEKTPHELPIMCPTSLISDLVKVYGGKTIRIPTKKEILKHDLFLKLLDAISDGLTIHEFLVKRKVSKFQIRWLKAFLVSYQKNMNRQKGLPVVNRFTFNNAYEAFFEHFSYPKTKIILDERRLGDERRTDNERRDSNRRKR